MEKIKEFTQEENHGLGDEEMLVFIKNVKDGLGTIYDSYGSDEERIKHFLSGLEFIMASDNSPVNKEQIIFDLESCKSENKNDFVEKVFTVLDPIIEFKEKSPQQFEQLSREHLRSDSKDEVINQLVYYEREKNGWIRIHLAQNRYIPTDEKKKLINLFSEGMKQLAGLAMKDESIRGIRADSQIIAEHPRVLKRFGFTSTGLTNEETMQQFFPDSNEEIHGAEMSREELIARYYQPENNP